MVCLLEYEFLPIYDAVMWIFPLALTVMLLLSLEINEETGQYTANAITWTVVARFIQGSPWATILLTDSSAVKRVKGLCGMKCTDLGRVTAITQGAWAISILLTISGIVTPLGLCLVPTKILQQFLVVFWGNRRTKLSSERPSHHTEIVVR